MLKQLLLLLTLFLARKAWGSKVENDCILRVGQSEVNITFEKAASLTDLLNDKLLDLSQCESASVFLTLPIEFFKHPSFQTSIITQLTYNKHLIKLLQRPFGMLTLPKDGDIDEKLKLIWAAMVNLNSNNSNFDSLSQGMKRKMYKYIDPKEALLSVNFPYNDPAALSSLFSIGKKNRQREPFKSVLEAISHCDQETLLPIATQRLLQMLMENNENNLFKLSTMNRISLLIHAAMTDAQKRNLQNTVRNEKMNLNVLFTGSSCLLPPELVPTLEKTKSMVLQMYSNIKSMSSHVRNLQKGPSLEQCYKHVHRLVAISNLLSMRATGAHSLLLREGLLWRAQFMCTPLKDHLQEMEKNRPQLMVILVSNMENIRRSLFALLGDRDLERIISLEGMGLLKRVRKILHRMKKELVSLDGELKEDIDLLLKSSQPPST